MNEVRIIDLSYSLTTDMLVYPGAERPIFQWAKRVNSEGANVSKITMSTHTGTHVDAAKHFLDNAPCIDEVPLSHLFGTAKLFRYTQKPKGQEITLEDVRSTGFELDDDMIFVMETGIQPYAETRHYNEGHPFPSKELCEWLIGKKIKAYMTDATSVDPLGSAGRPVHHCLLGAGIPIVENLKNLQQLSENAAFVIGAFPLKLQGRDGAPCRAIALPDVPSL
jgi:arylformamidase